MDDENRSATICDANDFDSVVGEIKTIAGICFPCFNGAPFNAALNDVVRLFRGEYPGYRACNVLYHDLRHTMAVTLAVARLMHGALEAGNDLSEREFTVGLISGLMHDTGYIQRSDDREGTGAKYTLSHIGRSIDFVRDYYRDDPRFRDDLDSFNAILLCTGFSIPVRDIAFPGDGARLLGMIVGVGDLLGQMADRAYLEKLLDLYDEFVEGGIETFESPLDLLEKTRGFYGEARRRFAEDLGNADAFSRYHFRARWGIDDDLYRRAIEANLSYLDEVVTTHRSGYRFRLRRRTPLLTAERATV